MRVNLSEAVTNAYPQANIAVIRAKVNVTKECPYTDGLKTKLADYIKSLGLDSCTYTYHPNIKSWRDIYKTDFKVNPKQFKSSVDALVRRVLTGKSIWHISNIVDLYNVCSVKSLLPMGGYDCRKIAGDITVRYGVGGETFQALGGAKRQEVLAHHIVYADEAKVLCWLWNHKDSELSCIDENTKDVVFFIDSAITPTHISVSDAKEQFIEHLKKSGATNIQSGILNGDNHCVEI